MQGKRFFNGLSFRVTFGLVIALLLVGIPFFVIFHRLHERQLIDGVRESMADLSQLILTSLERRMLESQPHLLDPDIRQLSREAGGARIMILDKEGQVRVSSDRKMLGKSFFKGGELCSSCHDRKPVAEQATMVEANGDEYGRSLLVIRNKDSCFNCHAASQAINGTLVVDLPMAQARARLRSNMLDMLLLGGIMLGITILVLGLLVDRLVVRRVKAVEKTTVAIQRGNLHERVAVSGADEIADLAAGLNVMTASLERSLTEIERHKDYLEKVINSIDDEIVVVDRGLHVVTANLAYLKGSGQTKDLLVGRSCRDADHCLCPNDMRDRCPARATFQTGAVEKCLLRSRTPDGHEKFVEIYSYPLTDDEGKVFQAIEVRRDITERRALEANLCHSDRLVSMGLLASGISHEINNPLASIVASSEGLVRRMSRSQSTRDDERGEILEYLQVISKEAMRAKAITERLLILSRKSHSHTYLLSVNRSLFETVRLVEFQANDKGIALVEEYAENLSEIKGDDPALRQVFLNLILNAIQSTHKGGRITVRTEAIGNIIQIEINDTGCGIPPDELPHLFEPFYSNRTDGCGTGLGLFISNTLVRQMGGELRVGSRAGHGSVFTVCLPAEQSEPGAPGSANAGPTQTRFST